MSKPEKTNSVANEFAQYNNFGFREEFVTALIDCGDTFFIGGLNIRLETKKLMPVRSGFHKRCW